MSTIHQGALYWADLNPVKGHEQAGVRPVLILQNNILNDNLSTVLIAPITTNLKAKGFLTTYFVTRKESHLAHDSVILLYQIRTIDKARLQTKISQLTPALINDIKKQLWLLF